MLIIQRSQIAAFSFRCGLATCPRRPYIPSCAEHGAGVGRSSTGRSYGAARKGRDEKSTGAVDETATGSANFFGPSHAAARDLPLDYDRRGADFSASAEHRPGSDRPRLGRSPWDVHLLRPPCGRGERCDGDRACARLLRRNLAVRSSTWRGDAGASAALLGAPSA
jgi:hypothetical protein